MWSCLNIKINNKLADKSFAAVLEVLKSYKINFKQLIVIVQSSLHGTNRDKMLRRKEVNYKKKFYVRVK